MKLCSVIGCSDKHAAKGMCSRHYKAEWAKVNADRIKMQRSEYYKVNAAEFRKKSAAYARSHAQEAGERNKSWRQDNRSRYNKQRSDWRTANPEKHCAKEAKRRAAKTNAIPAWANDFFMREIYDLAKLRTKTTGFRWEVDHMVPLKSPVVCGLHCELNLAVIPASDNRSKSNRVWQDMP